MCKMTESKEGLFVRGKSPLLEIKANKGDSYEAFVSKAAKNCQLKSEQGKILQLFKMNGARILNETVSVNGKQRPWTVGNYLAILHKSTSSIKLGIGYVAAPDDHNGGLLVSTSELEVSAHLNLVDAVLLNNYCATLMYRDPRTHILSCHQDI